MRLTILLLVAAAVILLALSRRQAHSRSATDDDVIDQLRKAGSDLSKPHPTDFYIYVPTEESANRIAKLLSAEGFKVAVEPAATRSNWLALASRDLILTPQILAELTRKFTDLARLENGDYDGWEAGVVK